MFILKTCPKLGHTEIKFNANVPFFCLRSPNGYEWETLMALHQGLANSLNLFRPLICSPDDNPPVPYCTKYDRWRARSSVPVQANLND